MFKTYFQYIQLINMNHNDDPKKSDNVNLMKKSKIIIWGCYTGIPFLVGTWAGLRGRDIACLTGLGFCAGGLKAMSSVNTKTETSHDGKTHVTSEDDGTNGVKSLIWTGVKALIVIKMIPVVLIGGLTLVTLAVAR